MGDHIKMRNSKVWSLNMVVLLLELQMENGTENQMGSSVYAGEDKLLPSPDLPVLHLIRFTPAMDTSTQGRYHPDNQELLAAVNKFTLSRGSSHTKPRKGVLSA